MGYTHYFDFDKKLESNDFDKIAMDMSVIANHFSSKKIKHSNAGGYHTEPVELFDGRGETKGIELNTEIIDKKITLTRVAFNGGGELGHETLAISLGMEWDFCKTARKPYDVAVCMTLLSIKYHTPYASIRSDGNLKEWGQAIRLWNKLFDRDVKFGGLGKKIKNLTMKVVD